MSVLAVSYGGGVNSTAMLCGMRDRQIKPDLVIFSDTGAEMPHTYDHVEVMRGKIKEWFGIELVTVRNKITIYEHAEKVRMLPSLAYGRRSCSQKFKHEPMERYIKKWMKSIGQTELTKAIGYHANEGHRSKNKPTEKQLCKGVKEIYWYPLIEWGWRQEDCMMAICKHGIERPQKSACFFCPASKPSEVIALKENHPELMKKALYIEQLAQQRHRKLIGLGGENNIWKNWLSQDAAQTKMMLDIEPMHLPCNCTD